MSLQYTPRHGAQASGVLPKFPFKAFCISSKADVSSVASFCSVACTRMLRNPVNVQQAVTDRACVSEAVVLGVGHAFPAGMTCQRCGTTSLSMRPSTTFLDKGRFWGVLVRSRIRCPRTISDNSWTRGRCIKDSPRSFRGSQQEWQELGARDRTSQDQTHQGRKA